VSTSFDQTPTQPPETPHPRPLPVPTLVVAGVLLIAPLIALALVGTYASAGPRLWGFPFFYWYQMLWVIITPLFTGLAYFLIKRARGER
jgi:hypothetical protein